jgi:hypothetical protein
MDTATAWTDTPPLRSGASRVNLSLIVCGASAAADATLKASIREHEP